MHAKKEVLITGGAKRVGKNLVCFFAEEGYDIALHYNSSYLEALELKEFIQKKYSNRIELFQCDFLKFDSIENFVNSVLDEFSYLNVLVNNASIFERGNFFQTTESMFDNHFLIHTKTVFFIIQYIYHRVKSNIMIINILDEKCVMNKSSENYFSYLLSKKAMMSIGDAIANCVSGSIINTILPGKIIDENNNCINNFSLLNVAISFLINENQGGFKIFV